MSLTRSRDTEQSVQNSVQSSPSITSLRPYRRAARRTETNKQRGVCLLFCYKDWAGSYRYNKQYKFKIHHMAKSMWTHMWLFNISFQTDGHQWAAITSSTLLVSGFQSGWRDLLPFRHKSTSEVRHRCWCSGLAHSRRSNSSQTCLIGLRSGLCAGQSSSSTLLNWENHFFMELHCVQVYCHVETGSSWKHIIV